MKHLLSLAALFAAAQDPSQPGPGQSGGPPETPTPQPTIPEVKKSVVTPEPKKQPKMPPPDSKLGDKTPAVFEFACKNNKANAVTQYKGRKIDGFLITETIIDLVAKSGWNATKKTLQDAAKSGDDEDEESEQT